MMTANAIDQPLVSILTTTYNRAHLIERSITSALTQDYRNLEIVVVDNGSTDNTLEVLQKHWWNNSLVRVFHCDQNTGSGGGRNLCVWNARGKYALFLDSDDELTPQAISTMVKVAEEFDGQISYVMADCCDAQTGELTGRGVSNRQFVHLEDSLAGRLSGEHLHLFRREWLQHPGFEEGAYGGEVIVWNRLLKIKPAVYTAFVARVYHKEGADRITHQRLDITSLQRQARGYEAYLEEFGADIKHISGAYYSSLLLAWAKLELLAQNRRKAWQLWWLAFQDRPKGYHARLGLQLCLPVKLVWTLTLVWRWIHDRKILAA